jgi:hypothetical protein
MLNSEKIQKIKRYFNLNFLNNDSKTKNKLKDENFKYWIFTQTTHQLFQYPFYLYKRKHVKFDKFSKEAAEISFEILKKDENLKIKRVKTLRICVFL